MKSLYEIDKSYMEVIDKMQDCEPEEFDGLLKELNELDDNLEVKAENYAKVMADFKADVQSITTEVKRLNDKKRTLQNKIKRMSDNLEDSLIMHNKRNLKTPLFNFSFRKSSSVVIDDINKIPTEFLRQQEPKADKVALKEYLKTNELDGAYIQEKESLSIR